MKSDLPPEQRAANFIHSWATCRSLVMGSHDYPLNCVQAFLAGLKWAKVFRENGEDRLESLLQMLERKLSNELNGSDDGVSWFDTLLERNEGDQDRAFQAFIELLRAIATREQVMAPDAKL